MRILTKIFFCLFVFVLTLNGCKGKNVSSNREECVKCFQDAAICYNKYSFDTMAIHLDSALFFLENGIKQCPNYKYKYSDLKIRVLLAKNEYKRGRLYLDSLEDIGFTFSYKKNYYSRLFEALLLEQNGDNESRDKVLSILYNDLFEYFNLHPSDDEVLADIFVTKSKFESKDSVLNEIELLKIQRSDKVDILDAIKNTIEGTSVK